MRRQFKVISVNPAVVGGATQYTSGDVLGVVTTVANAVLDNGGAAVLKSITITDKGAQKKDVDVYFFSEAPTSSIGADNAAFALADADIEKCLGRVSIAAADYTQSSNAAEATKRGLELVLAAKAASKSIYVALVTRADPTYTAADLKLKLGIDQG